MLRLTPARILSIARCAGLTLAVTVPVAVFLVATQAVALPATAPADAEGMFGSLMLVLGTAALDVARIVDIWVVDGFRRRPALMAGLAGFALLPMLAIVGICLRGVTTESGPPLDARSRANYALDPMPHAAWLEVGEAVPPLAIERELVQIGREGDNDICIEDQTVHRYHAVIERSRDAGFIITDVSGPDGNGVRVNGERLLKSSLSHGDIVEIGRARMRFATAA